MRYSVFSSKYEKLNEKESNLRAIVPSADLPYWIDHIESQESEKHIFNWEYGANNEPRRKLHSPEISLVQGKNSGCIYHAEIDSNKLEEIVLKLPQSFQPNKNAQIRFQNNFNFGIHLMLYICNNFLYENNP